MKLVLLGHRGTGKSLRLGRLKSYYSEIYPDLKYFDLDREIEFREGQTIHQIFEGLGEQSFRQL